jgi:hypothetical protein
MSVALGSLGELTISPPLGTVSPNASVAAIAGGFVMEVLLPMLVPSCLNIEAQSQFTKMIEISTCNLAVCAGC